MAPSSSLLGGALDGADGGPMGAAAADEVLQRILDLRIRRLGIAVDQLGRGQDPAADAIGALRDLLLEPGGLNRMRLLGRSEARERGDPFACERGDRRDAGAHRVAVDLHRAGAALPEPAAEARVIELKLIAQGVEQRHVGIVDVDRARPAVDGESELRHGRPPEGRFDWNESINSTSECCGSWSWRLVGAGISRRKGTSWKQG